MQQHFKRAKTLEPSNPLYAQSVEQAAQALPMWEAVQAQIRRTEQREIQPAGMQPKRPKQKVWMGLSESTWVEIAGWTIAGSVFAGIVIYFNRIGMANQGAQ